MGGQSGGSRYTGFSELVLGQSATDRQPEVQVIYRGGYVPDLGVSLLDSYRGWLVYRHPDGQWVTLADLKKQIRAIADTAIVQHHVADAFWKYWRENGETHKHGYYESTWGAIFAALDAAMDSEPAEGEG